MTKQKSRQCPGPLFFVLPALCLVTSAVRGQSFTYDAAGRLATATYGNGTTTSYQYDANGNLIRIVGTKAKARASIALAEVPGGVRVSRDAQSLEGELVVELAASNDQGSGAEVLCTARIPAGAGSVDVPLGSFGRLTGRVSVRVKSSANYGVAAEAGSVTMSAGAP